MRLVDSEHHRELPGAIEVHTVELTKYNLDEATIPTAPAIEQWAFFFLRADRYEAARLRELLPGEEFQRAITAVEMIAGLKLDPDILTASTPKKAKTLGRNVANFDAETWSNHCGDIVACGNVMKFRQNGDGSRSYSALNAKCWWKHAPCRGLGHRHAAEWRSSRESGRVAGTQSAAVCADGNTPSTTNYHQHLLVKISLALLHARTCRSRMAGVVPRLSFAAASAQQEGLPMRRFALAIVIVLAAASSVNAEHHHLPWIKYFEGIWEGSGQETNVWRIELVAKGTCGIGSMKDGTGEESAWIVAWDAAENRLVHEWFTEKGDHGCVRYTIVDDKTLTGPVMLTTEDGKTQATVTVKKTGPKRFTVHWTDVKTAGKPADDFDIVMQKK